MLQTLEEQRKQKYLKIDLYWNDNFYGGKIFCRSIDTSMIGPQIGLLPDLEVINFSNGANTLGVTWFWGNLRKVSFVS